jgi:type VI secretion system protein ImpD
MAEAGQQRDVSLGQAGPEVETASACGIAVLPPLVLTAGEPIESAQALDAGWRAAAERLLASTTVAGTLRAWATGRVRPGERLSRERLTDLLASDIAAIDLALGRQLDAILHHPRFQQLEASWRSLAWLCERADLAAGETDGPRRVEVRILAVSKRELARDRQGAVEFDQSMLWRKIYEEEFGTAGGTPFGMLLADYSFGRHPDEIDLLSGLAEIAAASFAPLITSPNPELLGLESLSELDAVLPLDQVHAAAEFVKWRSLREREESRFLGLCVPRVLARLPYDGLIGSPDAPAAEERSWSRRGFRYREEVDGPDGGQRLWTGSTWAFAAVVMAEFGRSGWFADIRGGSRGREGGGLVAGLPVESFGASEPFAFHRGPTDTSVSEATERRLSQGGFISLSATGGDGRAVFHSNQSVHRAVKYSTAEATANARISSMLQYMLCVSRFAHYIKVIGRNRVGSMLEASDLEHLLNEWIHDYVTPDDQASPEARARHPLRAAAVQVREEPGTAGSHRVVMNLQPHFQLDELAASVRLTTSIRRK